MNARILKKLSKRANAFLSDLSLEMPPTNEWVIGAYERVLHDDQLLAVRVGAHLKKTPLRSRPTFDFITKAEVLVVCTPYELMLAMAHVMCDDTEQFKTPAQLFKFMSEHKAEKSFELEGWV